MACFKLAKVVGSKDSADKSREEKDILYIQCENHVANLIAGVVSVAFSNKFHAVYVSSRLCIVVTLWYVVLQCLQQCMGKSAADLSMVLSQE